MFEVQSYSLEWPKRSTSENKGIIPPPTPPPLRSTGRLKKGPYIFGQNGTRQRVVPRRSSSSAPGRGAHQPLLLCCRDYDEVRAVTTPPATATCFPPPIFSTSSRRHTKVNLETLACTGSIFFSRFLPFSRGCAGEPVVITSAFDLCRSSATRTCTHTRSLARDYFGPHLTATYRKQDGTSAFWSSLGSL